MSGGAAISLPWDEAGSAVVLTAKTTQSWPLIQPLFAAGGYFPDGLTIASPKIISSSASETRLTGTALISAASFAVEATFSGSGQHVELELTVTVTLAKLTGDGGMLSAAWQPKVTFKSNGGNRKIDLDGASATLQLGSFELTATLQMGFPQIATRLMPAAEPKKSRLYVTSPGPQIVATLRPDSQRLSTLAGLYGLPDVEPGLALKALRLTADPWEGLYSVALDADGHWEILPGCVLTEVQGLILYAGDARTVQAQLRTAISLGGVPFEMKADYDASVGGWQFDGGMAPDQPLEVAVFVDALLKQFDFGGQCPQALHGATVTELRVSFNTLTGAFIVLCETRLPLRDSKSLAINLVVDIQGGRTRFHGSVTLGSLEFDLVFDATDRGRMLVASYSDPTPVQVKLGDFIAIVLNDKDANDQQVVTLANKASLSIKEALFAYEAHDDAASTWLLAADVEAGMDFSGLPLVGASMPAGQGARLLFQPMITSGGVASSALDDLMHAGALRLPVPLPKEPGFSVTTRLALGAEEIKLNLPVHMSDGKMAHAADAPVGEHAPAVTAVDDVSWIVAQRSFGPLAFERVGIRYDDGALDILLDAHLSAAGLTLALEGFGARVKLADPSQVTPILDGIGLDFRSAGIEIGGSLLRQNGGSGADAFDEYVGTAIVKAGALTIDAIGSYRIIDGHPSLFVYAELDYPIGGPSFFFVTGLAAAFGYNRSFKVPPIDKLVGFPLLSADVGKKDVRSASALRAASAALREYIPAEVGAVFLGVGVKFTSFQTIASSALLTASFGREVALDLIGRSTLIMPAGATREQAVAVVEMAWLASYRPAEGLLGLRAQLSPGSYVFSSDCHLAGGFAFYSWFSGPRAGDFVLTAGGYHPRFDLDHASRTHFPRVPRLGVAWQVSDALSIKGDAYYALTSSAAMAGGHLEMVWEQHPYKAWCKAGIDCLFEWKPLHYEGEAYVELGASYTFEFAGTRHITVEAAAELTVWGPPFSGHARVDLALFSFDMSFGPTKKGKPSPVHLFDDDGKGSGHGFSALLPQESKRCGVSVAGGLSRTLQGKQVWVVNPKALCLVVDSVIPSKRIHVVGMSRDPQDRTSDAPAQFGIAPMALGHDKVTSETTIKVTKLGDKDWQPAHLQYRLRTNKFPPALWRDATHGSAPGEPIDDTLIEALAGVEILPKGTPDCGTRLTWQGIDLFERHRPALRDGTYDVHVKQQLRANSGATAHGDACCKPLEAIASLRFEVAGEEFSLPASAVHSVFPPKGSLGDHSFSLPQIILERSTLPWERSAQVPNADDDTPWLALLVFDGEKKAAAQGGSDQLPARVSITVAPDEIPSVDALKRLCHVRVAPGNAGPVERAVVVANRPPSLGKLSTVHLVSLRGIEEAPGALRRLVSLWSWSFSCPARGAGFMSLMAEVSKASLFSVGVRLGHSLASGERSEAHYQGPLAPMGQPASTATGRRRKVQGAPDISQFAALELGRLLMLQNKSVSIGLLRLKRSLAHDARHQSQLEAAEHVYARKLPLVAPSPSADASLLPSELQRLLTPELATWVEGLLKLEGVPFRYLLSDESLLPKESLRSFELDEQWITNLLLGALGVGGVWRLSEPIRKALPEFEPALRVGHGPVASGERPFGALQKLTGVVLRSQLVSGWPAMTLSADGNREPLVCRRLAKNVLMVLFKGPISHVVFRLPQETLHFESAKEGRPIPKDWLSDAKDSVHLGQHVRLATQEEVHCDV